MIKYVLLNTCILIKLNNLLSSSCLWINNYIDLKRKSLTSLDRFWTSYFYDPEAEVGQIELSLGSPGLQCLFPHP